MNIRDFSRSFLTFTVPNAVNTARIQIDALCLLTDTRTGKTEETVLITPCKSEQMYRDRGLFQDPNYEFCGIWSRSEYVIFRTYPEHNPERVGEWEVGPNSPRFEEVKIDIATFAHVEPLATDRKVVEATLANRPVVARTHLACAGRMLSGEIEYPVKTMNCVRYAHGGRFQVDTGPILVPAQACGELPKGGHRVEDFGIAHVCYNTLNGHTEFVLRTFVPVGYERSVQVWHYGRIVELTAKHELFAVG